MSKTINIKGINNRYQIKKLTNNKECAQPRDIIEKLNLEEKYFLKDMQYTLLNNLYLNNVLETNSIITELLKKEIIKKINGYKQQDINRKILDLDNFINFNTILSSLIDSKLMCHYCNGEMLVLYNLKRDMIQWSVDRIDNTKGHNKDNFYLSCLKCNLKRRNQSADKFLFTKQLHIIKKE